MWHMYKDVKKISTGCQENGARKWCQNDIEKLMSQRCQKYVKKMSKSWCQENDDTNIM